MAVDLTIAYVALAHPRVLVLPLLAFFAQQAATHGVLAWRARTAARHVDWFNLSVLGFLLSAVLISAEHAARRRPGSAR